MSTDPNAILYYGIKLGDRPQLAGHGDDYHEANGQWASEHQPPEPEDRANYRTPEWDTWREKRRAFEQSPEHVELAWFGTENCECYVVHCPCLERRVEYDEQIDLGYGPLGQHPDADEWLRRFCEQFGIPFVAPSWHLAAWYF